MKQFSKKAFLSVLCVLMALWTVGFGIDYYCVTHLKKPVFAVSTDIVSENGTVYRGIGYTVECGESSSGVVCFTFLKLFGMPVVGHARGEVT